MKAPLLVPLLLLGAATAHAQTAGSNGAPANASSAGVVHSPPNIQWGPVPPVLPAGAQIAVLQGNPFGEGVYTLRLKMPNGYKVPPHFHPTDEMVTVVSGNLLVGMGDAVDEKATTTLRGGGFITAPAQMPHYAIARGATIVQVHGVGPFAITYVNPKDDPRGAVGSTP